MSQKVVNTADGAQTAQHACAATDTLELDCVPTCMRHRALSTLNPVKYTVAGKVLIFIVVFGHLHVNRSVSSKASGCEPPVLVLIFSTCKAVSV